MIDDIIFIASSDDIGATNLLVNLKRIKNRFELGKLKAGVVGLTNSGKSTFLNALLGKKYLPTSVQSQTAKKVSIIHTPNSPGELWVSKQREDAPVHIASDCESIQAQLLEMNTKVRHGDSEPLLNLMLHAPILFLAQVDEIELELSDTPGMYEAAAGNTTIDSNVAIEEMSAFILILNLQFLKTESEANIIKSLIKSHPNLFSKLSRIIILVNAYDVAFLDDNKDTLKPFQIPSYVADYLQNPEIIGINITSDQVFPFSAKWALNARMWLADPSGFLKMENAKLLYDEAIVLAQRANNFESDWEPFEKVTPIDIENISAYLLEFSRMPEIEERLKSMLYENGPSILMEATVDDSIAQILSIVKVIESKVEQQNLEHKQALLACQEKLLVQLIELESNQVSKVRPFSTPVSEINKITETLRESFTNKFNSIFQNHLVGFHMNPDRAAVFNRICGIKPLLTNPANAELKASWMSLSSILHQKNIVHAANSISVLRATLTAALNTFANDNPSCGELALNVEKKFALEVDQSDASSLVPAFPGIQIFVDGNTIANERLNQILSTYEIKWKTVQWRKRKRGGWFRGSKRKRMYKSESYQGSVYSPDITAVQNVLAADATNPWVQYFRSNIDSSLASISNQVVQLLLKSNENSFSLVKKTVTQAIENSQQDLQYSQDMIGRLIEKKKKLSRIMEDMKAFIN